MILSRLARVLRRLTSASAPTPAVAPLLPPPEQWRDQVALAGVAPEAWLDSRRARGRLYADVSADRIAALARRFPGQAAQTTAAAERILRHEFDLLGSGPYVPRDPSRSTRDGYDPIDWSLDPVSGLRFPQGFPHKTWGPAMRPGLADLKLPWELGRCQHWVTLGQAYRLTGDDRFALEIVRQQADFVEANPVGVGVQYVCTMDVAIRAFNWALAFELIRSAPPFASPDTLARAHQSLFDLGTFIEGNLENTYEVTSNHFLSNVLGLYALGLVFGDLPAGQRWLSQSRAWVEEEMRVQVLPDGADYESSIPYHRLVLELFLAAARLAQLEGRPLSTPYLESLARMVEFLEAVMRPDGLLPQVGDADDGRLHVFTEYGTWKPQDARHIFAPASFILAQPSWRGIGSDDGLWEAAWWGFDVAGESVAASPSGTSRLFESAGICVARAGDMYLLATNGRVGTNGFGNHKHNDLLGFEFHAAGEPLFVDPGSYVYTSDPDARNLFRCTSSHNTLQIDGVEQNDLRPDYLFRMFETSSVEHVSFSASDEDVVYTGRHTGYSRLPSPVAHERTWRMSAATQSLEITDRVSGPGLHSLRWHFHVAPGVRVAARGGGTFALTTPGRRWLLNAPPTLTAAISDAWYSPSYGVRVACLALDFAADADTADATFSFTIGPEEPVR